MTPTDIAWTAGMIFVPLLFGIAGIFVSVLYLEPVFLSNADTASKQGFAELAEFGFLIGGLLAGQLVALALIICTTRRCLSAATYERWVAMTAAMPSTRSPLIHNLTSKLLRTMKPTHGM